MNCEKAAPVINDMISGKLSSTQQADLEQHIAYCRDCGDALRGAKALAVLKNREVGETPVRLFEKIKAGLEMKPRKASSPQRFWLGTGFGGAIAASIFAVAFTFGWIGLPIEETPAAAEFMVELNEPRDMDIAIEADRPLHGATISILLSGGIEIDGYGDRHELRWTTDLDAGVNRLTIPVLAVEPGGGQMIVRLSHAVSEEVFVVRLKTDA